MTTRDSWKQAYYVGQADEGTKRTPTVLRDGLLRGQGRGEFWPLDKPVRFKIED
jgi:hypothetical protein